MRGLRHLKRSAAECADQLWFCSKLNKTQFVDVAPTLGVNHVTSGVVVSCVASLSIVFYALITVYI